MTTKKELEQALLEQLEAYEDAIKSPTFWKDAISSLLSAAMDSGFVVNVQYCVPCKCYHMAMGLKSDIPEGGVDDHSIH